MAAYEINVAGYILQPVTLTSYIETMAALNHYWTPVPKASQWFTM